MIEQVTKEDLKDFILKTENKDALEVVLDSAIKQYNYPKQYKQFPIREKRELTNSEIMMMFEEVTDETRNFLQLRPAEVPKISVGSYNWRAVAKEAGVKIAFLTTLGLGAKIAESGFHPEMILGAAGFWLVMDAFAVGYNYNEFQLASSRPENRYIRITSKKETDVADKIADLYDQHILKEKTDLGLSSLLARGHVLGTRNIIANRLSQKRENPDFLYKPSREMAGALKDAYIYVCKQRGESAKTSLLDNDAPITDPSFVPIFKWGPGHRKWILPENISVAVVAIAEEKASRGIYRQILREDLSFLN